MKVPNLQTSKLKENSNQSASITESWIRNLIITKFTFKASSNFEGSVFLVFMCNGSLEKHMYSEMNDIEYRCM